MYTTEIISVIEPSKTLDNLLEELNVEFIYSSSILDQMYKINDALIVNNICKINNTMIIDSQKVSKEIAKNIFNKFDFFKATRGMIGQTIRYINYKYCDHVILFRDTNGKRLISMCICKKIGSSQFHVHITKSMATSLYYILNNMVIPEKLSIELHKAAMKFGNVDRIYSPPLPIMAKILKSHFRFRWIPTKINGELNYAPERFTDNELRLIIEYWPEFASDATFCFWI